MSRKINRRSNGFRLTRHNSLLVILLIDAVFLSAEVCLYLKDAVQHVLSLDACHQVRDILKLLLQCVIVPKPEMKELGCL